MYLCHWRRFFVEKIVLILDFGSGGHNGHSIQPALFYGDFGASNYGLRCLANEFGTKLVLTFEDAL